MTQQPLPIDKPRRKSPESVRRLSPKEVFQLATLVAEAYTSTGQNDTEFAAYASEKLTIPGINRNHVATSREIHGIPAKNRAATAIPNDTFSVEISARVLTLEKQVRKLFALGEKTSGEVSYQHEEPSFHQAAAVWARNFPAQLPLGEHGYRFALAVIRGEWK